MYKNKDKKNEDTVQPYSCVTVRNVSPSWFWHCPDRKMGRRGKREGSGGERMGPHCWEGMREDVGLLALLKTSCLLLKYINCIFILHFQLQTKKDKI